MNVIGYTQTGSIEIEVEGQRLFVPDDLDNIDRQEIALWEATGNEIPAHVPSPEAMPDLAPYQFRAMLMLSGKQEALYAFIEALPDPQKTIAQSKLEYSLVFKRDNDLVMGAQQALGLTTAELDALWLQASSIR